MSHSHNQPPATTGHAAITKHADTSVHRTQKSFKSDRRDKPKHSGKIVSGPKKGGGGGGTVWGKPGDEVKGFEEDPNDPNYDPNDYVMDWEPSDSTAIKFASSLADFAKFKSTIKEAAREYLASGEANEFHQVVKSLSMTVFHQDLFYLLIRFALDLNDSDRSRISSLVASLCKNGFITNLQMAAGARKLYNSLPDISLDVPNAKTLIREQISFAVAGGLLDANAARTLELEQEALADTKAVDSTKAKIHSILAEFFRSEDLDDTVQSLKELNAPHLAFETVKKLISLSLDLGNRQREGASVFLSDSRGYLQLCDIEKGFTILLERVDDMINDVPQLLKHLSIFIARAVVDEALPPAFLVRVDLNANDLGSRVLQQAQVLLNQEAASDRLIYCWEDEEEEEQEKRTPKSQTNSTEELAQFAPTASSSGASTSASEAK